MSTTDYQFAQNPQHATPSAQTAPERQQSNQRQQADQPQQNEQRQQADQQQWLQRATQKAEENPYLTGAAPTPPPMHGSGSGGEEKPRKVRLGAAIALAAGALVVGGVGGSVITHAISGSSASTQRGPGGSGFGGGSGDGFGGGPGGNSGNGTNSGTSQQGGSGSGMGAAGGNSGTSQNGNTTSG